MTFWVMSFVRSVKKKLLKISMHGFSWGREVVVDNDFSESKAGVLVVTAFYPVKSKRPIDQYKKWIKNFFRAIDEKIVVYTDKKGRAIITEILHEVGQQDHIESKIFLIEKPFYAFTTNLLISSIRNFLAGRDVKRNSSSKKYLVDFWDRQNHLDPEFHIHTSALYLIWLEKCHFCAQALAYVNDSNAWIVWLDIGSIRDAETFDLVKNGSINIQKMPKNDRILGLAINNPDADYLTQSDKSTSIRKNFIGGGVFCGSRAAWFHFAHLVAESIGQLLSSDDDIFIGKDQELYNLIYHNHNDFFDLYKINLDVREDQKDWFALMKYLYS